MMIGSETARDRQFMGVSNRQIAHEYKAHLQHRYLCRRSNDSKRLIDAKHGLEIGDCRLRQYGLVSML